MSHLSMEDLARLVDEPAEPWETDHLAACVECREELAALREQTLALGDLPVPEPSTTAWEPLLRRLRAEGLVRGPAPAAWTVGRWAGGAGLRAAASIALLLAGGVAGATLQARLGSGPPLQGGTAPGAMPAVATLGSGGDLQLASTQLQQAEEEYLAALARYEELTRGDDAGDAETAPLARLAALEGIVVTTRAALDEAPTDPVINGYHLTALAQRDATLRRIATGGGDPWF